MTRRGRRRGGVWASGRLEGLLRLLRHTGLLLCLALLAPTGAWAQQPTCTQPTNDGWQSSPVRFRTSAWAGAEPQTDSQWEATTVAGGYGMPVFSVMNGPGAAYNRSGLTAGLRYYWRARHQSALGWTGWCTEERFRYDDVDPTLPSMAPTVVPTAAGGVDFAIQPGSDAHSGIDHYNMLETSDAGTAYGWSVYTLSFSQRLGPGTYRWQVRAVDKADNSSALTAFSSEVSIAADVALPVLDAPTVTPYASALGDFTVAMPPDAGGASFALMRRLNDGPPTNHGAFSGTASQGPPNEGAWQYRIALISGARVGNWSAWSQKVYRDTTDPEKPDEVHAAPQLGRGPLQVSWEEGDDKGAYPSGVSGYLLERRGDGGAWGRVGATDAGRRLLDDPPTGRWQYRVTSVDHAGNASPASGPSEQVLVDKTPPSPPAPVSASASALTVTVWWSAAVDLEAGLAGYQVLRRPEGQTTLTHVADTTSPTASEEAPPGRWVYRVVALDRVGNTAWAESGAVEARGFGLAEACTFDTQCESGACVQQLCCDAPCAGPCDSSGHCPSPDPLRARVGCGCEAGPAGAWGLAALALWRGRRSARVGMTS